MTILAACGASPTATTAPVATTAATARPSTAPSTAPTAASAATPATTTTGATATRAASPTTSSAATVTRASSPAAGTATRTGSATPSSANPGRAYATLQAQPSSRQSWIFSGFSIAGLGGDLRPAFAYNGGNQQVKVAAGGVNLEAYDVGGTLYVPNPLGGFVVADQANPFTATARTIFSTPATIVNTLAPQSGSYSPSGTETINGRQATRYLTNVTLADLGFVNPALAGQRGTATTTVWVDNAQGYLVALDSTITADGTPGTAATARLDVTDVGQVPAIAAPR